jgi:uncharacterized membrane protein
MDILFLVVKFLHIAAAIVWIGAGVGLMILGLAADRATDREAVLRIINSVMFLAPRVFVPASLATLVFGAAAAWMSWGFGTLWIVLGLIGWAATFVTGNFFLKPRADRVAAIMAKEGPSDSALALGREMLTLSKFDYVMLFVVVADMVFKPTLNDVPVLVAMAVVIVVSAIAFVVPVLRRPVLVPA